MRRVDTPSGADRFVAPLLWGVVAFAVVALAIFSLFTAPAKDDAPRAHAVGDAPTDAAVPLGTKIPDLTFKDIRYLTRSLTDLGECEAIVFVFTNTTCPLVRRYMPRLNQLYEKYSKQKVQFVSVNVGPGDSIRDMASHALEFGAVYPVVKDIDGKCVRLLGVERTPEVVILDKERKIVYRGRIDDQYRIGGALPKARRNDLEEALIDILAERPVRVATTPVDGCQITLPDVTEMAIKSLTYHRDVKPIIDSKCASCHQKGAGGPFSLTTFRQVRNQGEMIGEVVEEERMPPWYAHDGYGAFQNDRSLTAKERETILGWVHAGMPQGEAPESDKAAGDDAKGDAKAEHDETAKPSKGEIHWTIDKPDLVLTMLSEHRLPAEGFVPYRYVVLPHVFIRDTWIEAFEIVPDNKAVVHHANLAYGSPDAKPGRRTFITGYVPGGQAMDLTHFDNDVAFRVPSMSVLGLQIHYVTTGKPERCKISVGVRFKRDKVRKRLRHNLADPRFRIPPHHPAFPVKDSFRLKDDASILGLFCHMHLRGKDMTFFAHKPDGSTETLLQIPNYSFDWQLGYEIEPGKMRLPKGTKIEVVAHYDNSAFNPYNPEPTATVRYGPQTVDEMMNGYVFYTFDAEELNLKINSKTGGER